MAKTVVGVFDDFNAAQAVVHDLTDHGFSHDEISIVANNTKGEFNTYGRERAIGDDKMDDTTAEQAGSGAIAGTGVGAALGLLVGVGLLAIPGVGPVLAAGPIATALGSAALGAGVGAAAGGLVGPLVDAGVPRPDAEVYNETVRRGGTLVMVRTSDDRAQNAIDIMNRYNVVDIHARGEEYRRGDWTGFDANAEPYTAQQINDYHTSRASSTTPASSTLQNQGETTLPVVEEELHVGKRQVERGGARIQTHVTEQPVEEQVRLREEHVNVERRPTDRPVGKADATAFREQTLEISETAEEAVINKEAHVVEEVVVRKDVEERTETIRDTVRRTDVDIEQAGPTSTSTASTSTSAVSAYDSDFRAYYNQHLSQSGYTYEQYSPVFQYGHNLATHQRYRNSNWSTIEPEARQRWEERNPGSWDQFKDSVRFAWERARGNA